MRDNFHFYKYGISANIIDTIRLALTVAILLFSPFVNYNFLFFYGCW